MNPIRSMRVTQHVRGLTICDMRNGRFGRRDTGNQVIGWHISTVVADLNQDHHYDLRRWDLGVGCGGCFLPPSGRRGNSYRHRNSRDRCGEEYILVTQGGSPRASGAQQVADRRCIVRPRWKCRFVFATVIRLDPLIAVGHVLRLWVDS